MGGVTEQDIDDAHRLWREATSTELYAGGVLSVASVLARYRAELTSNEAVLRRARHIMETLGAGDFAEAFEVLRIKE